MSDHTIAALATPTGKGGIGIIRVSGGLSLDLALKHFVLPGNMRMTELASHHVNYGFFCDKSGKIVDEVLLIYMKAPRSYTAEDVVEIQSHSNPFVLRTILSVLLDSGAALAEPGEFTKRAFLNGRIDLTQAEAVIDIINVRNEFSLDVALSQITGHLKSEIVAIKEIMDDFHARIEAAIDFPDDVGEIVQQESALRILRHNVFDKLAALKKNHDELHVFREGIRMVIVGPPNSGKSSLLNALLNKEKAIVTPVPGTTRDLIEDVITIEGITFELTDTAGVQDTDDPVERLGIQKTMERISTADVIILMIDATIDSMDPSCESILTIYNNYIKTKKILVVENKIDRLVPGQNRQNVLGPDLSISVLQRKGLDELKQKISDLVVRDMPENRCTLVPNLRQCRLIEQAMESAGLVMDGLEMDMPCDLLAVDVKGCVQSLDRILGLDAKDDVLDRIFNSFCIGK